MQVTTNQIHPAAATILTSQLDLVLGCKWRSKVLHCGKQFTTARRLHRLQHLASTHRKENFPDTAEAAVSRMRELGIRSAREREVEVSQQERAEMEMERAQLSSWQVRET